MSQYKKQIYLKTSQKAKNVLQALKISIKIQNKILSNQKTHYDLGIFQ